jgi:hypothetical protein
MAWWLIKQRNNFIGYFIYEERAIGQDDDNSYIPSLIRTPAACSLSLLWLSYRGLGIHESKKKNEPKSVCRTIVITVFAKSTSTAETDHVGRARLCACSSGFGWRGCGFISYNDVMISSQNCCNNRVPGTSWQTTRRNDEIRARCSKRELLTSFYAQTHTQPFLT